MSPFDPLSTSSSSTALPLPLTIRFTTSVPDLPLDIPSPSSTTIIALKHLIRSRVSPPTSQHRFRLIQSGKLLRDDDILSSVIKLPSAPPPRVPDPKGKGKAVEPPIPRIYINCSIGDVLTPAELTDEEEKATKARDDVNDDVNDDGRAAEAASTTIPAPRGFDRLLSAGFTPAEVNQLRLQFLSIQSNIHTPETMPSPTTLRRMEDAWIDGNAGQAAGSGGGEGGFDFGEDEVGGSSALDDLLWGNIMGFLWPLGCVGWLVREPGVWSKRRQMAVFTGFMMSVCFGALRVVS